MKIAKQFRWEAAHRLPWHEGVCKNLHGHSYRMFVELEGTADGRGMVMDFKQLKALLAPLVEAWDHATLVAASDAELREVLCGAGWKHAVLPYDTTAENLSTYVADYLCAHAAAELLDHRIHTLRVRIAETETCYAEAERLLMVEEAGAAARIAETA